MQIMDFRKKVSRVFDDNLRTLQWENMVDYLIMFMILLSTLEVFLSTFEWGPTIKGTKIGTMVNLISTFPYIQYQLSRKE